MTQNILDLSFAEFDKAAAARGYKAVQYSQTGFFVKSMNGVRVELQKTKGGVNSIGYGSSQAIVDLLKAAVNSVAGPKNKKIAELKGSVNFAHESLDTFFDLVTFTETVALPEAKGRGGRPAGSTKKAAETEQKTDGDVSELMTADENVLIQVEDAAMAPATDHEAIKAANLKRLREVGAKRAKKNEEAKEQLETDTDALLSDFDMPEFLMKDSLMDGKVEGKPAAE